MSASILCHTSKPIRFHSISLVVTYADGSKKRMQIFTFTFLKIIIMRYITLT